MSSVHDRLTVAEGRASAPSTESPGTAQDAWLTFEAYVSWIAAANGVASTALSVPPPEGERDVEDRRSTLVVPLRLRARKKTWPMRSVPASMPVRRKRLSATVIRRALAKTG